MLKLFTFVHGQKLIQATPATLKEQNGYRIRQGDELTISVLNEPDCNIRQTVPNDGLIRLSYIGDFKAINIPVKNLESLIKQEYILKGIFLRPIVNVSITEYSKRLNHTPLENHCRSCISKAVRNCLWKENF